MKHLANEDKWQTLRDKIATLPIFEKCRPIMDFFGVTWPNLEELNLVFKKHHPLFDLVFIDQPAKPSRRKNKMGDPADASLLGYIDRIYTRKEVPMRRDSLHDFFNFITFVMFPKTKLQLMKIHYEETLRGEVGKSSGGGRGRTRLQDFLTLFDEGGAIKCGANHQEFIVFGHGIFEQFAVNPKPVRCMTWHDPSASNTLSLSELDEFMSESIKDPTVFENTAVFCGVWVPEELVLS